MARPSSYSEEIADRICEWLADGKSLKAFCDETGNPSQSMVYRWVAANAAFREKYARAREDQAETLADEIVAIADEATDSDTAQVARIKIDARKWVAGKLAPKKYGDKLDLNHSGEVAVKRVVADV